MPGILNLMTGFIRIKLQIHNDNSDHGWVLHLLSKLDISVVMCSQNNWLQWNQDATVNFQSFIWYSEVNVRVAMKLQAKEIGKIFDKLPYIEQKRKLLTTVMSSLL